MNAVQCPTSTFCVAVGASGYATTYNGTTWATATDVDSTRSMVAVSCTSATFCGVVDGSGYALSYTGSWAGASDIDGASALTALSCVSTTKCVATDGSGNVFTSAGATWSSASNANVDTSHSISAVSCPTTSFCAATDGSGYGVLFQPLSTISQLTWDSTGSVPLVLSDGSSDYIYGPNNEPVEEVNVSTELPTFLTYSASDSSWLATNQQGQIVAFWRYDAFGDLASGTPDSPFGFSGQYTDASTGLINDRARLYESQTGGFTTRDPAFDETDQAYAYASDDPINRSDSSGLSDLPWYCSLPFFTCDWTPERFANENAADQYLQSVNPGSVPKYQVILPNGIRRVYDVYAPNDVTGQGIAFENKVNASSLNSQNRSEIYKDFNVSAAQGVCSRSMNDQNEQANIGEINWEFWPNLDGVTGPTAPLAVALETLAAASELQTVPVFVDVWYNDNSSFRGSQPVVPAPPKASDPEDSSEEYYSQLEEEDGLSAAQVGAVEESTG